MAERILEFDFDVAIIGGGSAGYAAARTTAAAGLKTAVVEGGAQVGGLCILRGCMPTKALLWTAEVLHLAQRSSLWGLVPNDVGFDFDKVMARKDVMIEEFASYRRQQLNDGRFVLVRAKAAFSNSHTLLLDNGATLTTKHFIVATGSKVAPPPLPCLNTIGTMTSDDALERRTLPKSLIVLGGGAVAVEFAQFFARLGVKVVLIQRGNHVLRDFDDDASSVVEAVFQREGICLATGTRLLNCRVEGGLKVIGFERQSIRTECAAEEILLALGRVPAIESLCLESAGVRVESGRIWTDDTMRTSAPHIWAAGDCTGRHEIVHIAIQQAEIAAHNIIHPKAPRAVDDRLLVSVVFTEPQVATVGLTEKAARACGIPFLSASYPFNDHGKSLIMEARDGFVKLLACPSTGEILGGCCVGPLGGELIHEIVVAMHQRLTVHTLASIPHYHPTLAEIWTYPAEELASAIPQRNPARPGTMPVGLATLAQIRQGTPTKEPRTTGILEIEG